MKRSLRLILFSALILVLTSIPLLAVTFTAEFSGDMTMTANGKTSIGKIFVKPDKIRQEIIEKDGSTITILRLDKMVSWTLMPAMNKYMEIALNFDPNGPQAQEAEYEEVNMGTETVSGYLCDVVKFVYTDKKLGMTTTWRARNLGGFGVKTESANSKGKVQSTTIYSNIKVAPQPDSLFEIPAGFTKFSIFGKP